MLRLVLCAFERFLLLAVRRAAAGRVVKSEFCAMKRRTLIATVAILIVLGVIVASRRPARRDTTPLAGS